VAASVSHGPDWQAATSRRRIAGVNLVEEDPNDDSVGYGGLPMKGHRRAGRERHARATRRCGSVASIRTACTRRGSRSSSWSKTDHIMLAGEGATGSPRPGDFPRSFAYRNVRGLPGWTWKQSLRDPTAAAIGSMARMRHPRRTMIAELRRLSRIGCGRARLRVGAGDSSDPRAHNCLH